MQNSKYHISGKSGQSLIEAMVAIAIATVGFIGIASLLAQSLYLAKVISDQETATYLASEGIELAKNLLDHDINLASFGVPWGSCWNGGKTLNDPHVELDYGSVDCSKHFIPGHGDPLYYDPVTHYYGYNLPAADNPVKTGFVREIIIQKDTNPDMTVLSIVTWATGGYSQSLTLEDHFYNWKP
ncbi:MAG: hypothetical protein KGJ13_04165 [Patescibacteria group bacterium]|nr:hypothetical protein [Patescibacteria group bacterium]